MFSWVPAFAALSGQQAADRATEAWAQLYCGDGEGRGAEGGKACSYRSYFPVACDPQLLCGGQERGGAGMTVGWRGGRRQGCNAATTTARLPGDIPRNTPTRLLPSTAQVPSSTGAAYAFSCLSH